MIITKGYNNQKNHINKNPYHPQTRKLRVPSITIFFPLFSRLCIHRAAIVYLRVCGHTSMHLPQIVISPPNPRLDRSRAVFQHFTGSRNSSRHDPNFHNLPVIAFAGQASAHTMQLPHFEALVGVAVCSGASVRIDEIRIAEPYSSVTSKQLLPIQPIPARVAIVLCGKVVLSSPSPLPTCSRVCATAL